MKRKHSKFEPESTPSSNDIIGLGFDSDPNQLGEHEPYPDTMRPDSKSKPFIELFSTYDDRFNLQGSRRYGHGHGHGHIPETIERIMKIKNEDAWLVESETTDNKFYKVTEEGECECPDSRYRGGSSKNV